MKQLIRAKHWQIFLLFVGFPMIAQIVMIGLATSGGNSMIGIFFTMAFGLLGMAVFFTWLWSVGHFLHSILPEQVQMSLSRFRAFLIFPVVYMALFILIFFFGIGQIGILQSNTTVTSFVGIIVPLHLFAMFCIFYSFYFIAKALKSIELDRTATFSDYAGEFFLIWFYFIGIWILQPRINALADHSPGHGLEEHLVE